MTISARPTGRSPLAWTMPAWASAFMSSLFMASLVSCWCIGGAVVTSPVERQALVDLYLATNGSRWVGNVTGWAEYNNSSVDPCLPVPWTGLYCSFVDGNSTEMHVRWVCLR